MAEAPDLAFGRDQAHPVHVEGDHEARQHGQHAEGGEHGPAKGDPEGRRPEEHRAAGRQVPRPDAPALELASVVGRRPEGNGRQPEFGRRFAAQDARGGLDGEAARLGNGQQATADDTLAQLGIEDPEDGRARHLVQAQKNLVVGVRDPGAVQQEQGVEDRGARGQGRRLAPDVSRGQIVPPENADVVLVALELPSQGRAPESLVGRGADDDRHRLGGRQHLEDVLHQRRDLDVERHDSVILREAVGRNQTQRHARVQHGRGRQQALSVLHDEAARLAPDDDRQVGRPGGPQGVQVHRQSAFDLRLARAQGGHGDLVELQRLVEPGAEPALKRRGEEVVRREGAAEGLQDEHPLRRSLRGSIVRRLRPCLAPGRGRTGEQHRAHEHQQQDRATRGAGPNVQRWHGVSPQCNAALFGRPAPGGPHQA